MGGRAGVTPYDLRRSGLRHLVRSGSPITTAMAISGHVTVSTFRRYDVQDVEDTRRAIARVAEWLKPHNNRTAATAGRSRIRGLVAEAGGNRTHRSWVQPGAGRL